MTTTETPMRERIARAIATADNNDDVDAEWLFYLDHADAVLDAMREPTSRMTDKLIDAGQARYFWKQMIDAAKEGR